MKKILVSIIITTKNNFNYLRQCLKSIEKYTQDINYEIIIIDNASQDKSFYDTLNSSFKGKVIEHDENKSFSESNNRGVKEAKGEYICLLNNDTLVTKNWLLNALKVFKEEKNVGAVGVKILIPGKGTIHHAGVKSFANGLTDHIYFNKPANYQKANKRYQCFAVTGACMITPKKLYKKIGGLFKEYWYGWEDIDYNNCLKDLGYKIFYEPTSVIYHYESRTPGRYSAENNNINIYMQRWIYSGKLTRKDLE